MSKEWYNKSLHITGLNTEEAAGAAQWLAQKGVSFRFNSSASGFEQVKLDSAEIKEFKEKFPRANVKNSAFSIEFGLLW